MKSAKVIRKVNTKNNSANVMYITIPSPRIYEGSKKIIRSLLHL